MDYNDNNVQMTIMYKKDRGRNKVKLRKRWQS